jgi:5-methylcytosine-specific restriction endonuclease McrA
MAKKSSWQEMKWKRGGLWKLVGDRDGYEKYLAGPHWQALRKRKLEQQKSELGHNCCEECREQPEVTRETALHVHHRTYERLGEERLEDLSIICRPCHDKEHGRDINNLRRFYGPSRFE